MKTVLILWLLSVGGAAAECFGDCELDGGNRWICPKTFGCEDCPYEETCEKLCRRCAGLEENAYGGLGCDCPEPPPDCFEDCDAGSGLHWLCPLDFGCTECPETNEELCEKLCRRCEGLEDNGYAGLDCDCSGDPTEAPVTPAPVYASPVTRAPVVAPVTTAPVVPDGKCIPSCTEEEGAKGVCAKSNGECAACPVDDTCEKLCRRCEGKSQNFGGLDCGDCSGYSPVAPVTDAPVDAPTYAPVDGPTDAPVDPSLPCWRACHNDDEGMWICGKDRGCQGCPYDDTCDNLCDRCASKPDSTYGGLACDCPDAPTVAPVERPAPCWKACTDPDKGMWICGSPDGCLGCPESDTCDILCDKCYGKTDNEFGGLDCDCSADDPTDAPVEPPTYAPVVEPTTAAPVAPSGPCWTTCNSDDTTTWVCSNQRACQGCELDTCDKLCDRCATVEDSTYGGLGCDCPDVPTAAPVPKLCYDACDRDTGAGWVCNNPDIGCIGCEDTDDVCAKLCLRCDLPEGETKVAGLTCTCTY